MLEIDNGDTGSCVKLVMAMQAVHLGITRVRKKLGCRTKRGRKLEIWQRWWVNGTHSLCTLSYASQSSLGYGLILEDSYGEGIFAILLYWYLLLRIIK